jgi:hypothetical protein
LAESQSDGVEAGELVIIVRSVQGYIGLIAPGAVDLAETRGAGLQREQADDIAGIEWKLFDAVSIERIAQRRIGGLQRFLAGGHGDCLSYFADFEPYRNLGCDIHRCDHSLDGQFLETRSFGFQAIVCRRQTGKGEFAGRIRSLASRHFVVVVGESNPSIWDSLRLRVERSSANTAGSSLSRGS